jgi:TolB-like protein
MKTRLKLRAAAVVILLMAAGVFAQELPINEVISRSARGIEDALPQGTMVAVLNFDSPSKAFSDFAIEELNGQLVEGGKITIVDRNNLALITEELQLQMSGAVSDELVVSIGRQLGAHYIVTGSLSDIGTGYRFRVKVTSVEKAAVLKQISLNLKSDEQVAFLLGKKFKKTKQEKVRKSRKHDWYFAPGYVLPVGGMPLLYGNLEGGLVWGNGTFFGIDIGYGHSGHLSDDELNEETSDFTMAGGFGFNLGGVYDLPVDNLQLVYGGAVGPFLVSHYISEGNGKVADESGFNVNFLAPFVKLRWKFVELSYRGLLGYWGRLVDYQDLKYDNGFGWNNHQVMLGVHFATSKRVRK